MRQILRQCVLASPNNIWRCLASVAIGAMMTMPVGCISVHYEDQDGRLRSIGLSWQRTLPAADGFAYRVYSPGLSARLGIAGPGLAVGWHELTLLFEDESHAKPSHPVAFETVVYGIEAGNAFLALGYARTFGIPWPDRDVIQSVVYIPENPERIRVRRKEVP